MSTQFAAKTKGEIFYDLQSKFTQSLTQSGNCLITSLIYNEILVHGSCLRSRALSQVYLSLTFQFSETAVVTFEINSTFWTVPVKLNSKNFSMKNSCVQ